MENKALVKYTGNVNNPFDPNLIDNLLIKSFFDDSMEKCEHWGWNNEGENEHPFFDFGKLGKFIDFEVYKCSTRLYFGELMDIGFHPGNKEDLPILDHGQTLPDHSYWWSKLSPEKLYSRRPGTMTEFIEMIIDFIQFVLDKFVDIKMEYQLDLKKRRRRHKLYQLLPKTDDGLPF